MTLRTARCALLLALTLWAHAALGDPPRISAHRGTPTLDGHLDDPVWRAITPTGDFRQRQPALGQPASLATEVRIAYDDRALYVAVECVTEVRPEERLARRDVLPPGEWVRVLIDTRGEGSSAFAFTANPAGVQVDAIVRGDDDDDNDLGWDAVWQVETEVRSDGWAAEFALPWRILRFDAAHPDLRVQVERNDLQHAEVTALVAIANDAPAFVARFARLPGVSGLTPRRVFELRPYLLGTSRLLMDPERLDPSTTVSGSLGADLKIGLTQDLILDVTVNPEFGTTEVDPANLNLSTIEIQLGERRPFFLEGQSLFRTPMSALYTRRIGAAQGVPGASRADSVVTSVDPIARVWGAAQLAGRIGPWSLAILDAVTGPVGATERSVESPTAPTFDREVSPLTNWLALRLRRPLGAGSSIGTLMTHVGRVGRPHDVAGGMDWDWRFPDGVHRVRGQLMFSHSWNPAQGERDGYGFFMEAARAESPVFLWSARVRSYSRDFDLNGLGYLERADYIRLVADATVRTRRPVGPFRNVEFNPFIYQQTNTTGVLLERGLGADLTMVFRNLWALGGGAAIQTPRYDDRETRGGIPFALSPTLETWGWFTTDNRRALRARIEGGLDTYNQGLRPRVSLTVTVTPAAFATFSLRGTLRLIRDTPRWVGTTLDSLARPVFGLQRGEVYDLTLRADLAVTRRASLNAFAQLLFGSLRYTDYSVLLSPERLEPWSDGRNADYDRAVLTLNAVGRYEYRPGSFFSAAFVHRAQLLRGAAQAGFGAGLGLLELASPETQLLLKVTWLFL